MGQRAGMFLKRLTLTDFRNYPSLNWQLAERISVLSGANGSGKTNLLEAISLLVPGRGLRGARNAELARRDGSGGWAVAGRFAGKAGAAEIGTGALPGAPADRRVVRLDGAPVRSQSELAGRAAAVWLTPQMDRLLSEGPSGRRRFLDRLVWGLEPAHAREIAAHDTAQRNRNRLLSEQNPDHSWLAALERAVARHAVAAAAARAATVSRLNAALATGASGEFPRASIGLKCPIADELDRRPALKVEEWLRSRLESQRASDAVLGTSSIGVHRSDMVLSDYETGTEASLASTGQQKAFLISLILAHAALVDEERGFPPLLLLDEPAVHLDSRRREALFAALLHMRAQVLLSGTDAEMFSPLAGRAELVQITDGTLSRNDFRL
jgi:DNA replication and repair protein RecF